jgi:hypothetical protein
MRSLFPQNKLISTISSGGAPEEAPSFLPINKKKLKFKSLILTIGIYGTIHFE